MSEYQYYEFRAIDKPLSAIQQEQVAALSSRAEVSSRAAVFVYNYSDFPGDEIKLVSKTFDIMLYLTNWGSRRLIIRLPLSLIDAERVDCLSSLDAFEQRYSADGKSLLLDFSFETEDGGWLDGEGWLDPLLPLREMLLSGDYRPLYLAWLKAAQIAWDAEDIDEDTFEPMIPAGLKSLDRDLNAWSDFLALDQDLLAAAAELSPELGIIDHKSLISRLPKQEQLEFLARLSDDEPLLSISLKQRLEQLAGLSPQSPAPRSIADLIESAEALRTQRLALQKRQAEQADAKLMKSLLQQEPAHWERVARLIDEKKPKAYDEALVILKNLEQLAVHQNKLVDFRKKIKRIRSDYPNRSALLSRLNALKL